MNNRPNLLQRIALEVAKSADEGVLKPTAKHIAEKVGAALSTTKTYMSFLNKHSRPCSHSNNYDRHFQPVALVISEATDKGIKPSYDYVARQLGLGRSTVASSISFLKKHSRQQSSDYLVSLLQKIALVVAKAGDEGVLIPSHAFVAEEVGVSKTIAYQYISFLNRHSRPESRPAPKGRRARGDNLQKVALAVVQAADKGIRPTGEYVAEKAGIGLDTAYRYLSFLNEHSRPESRPKVATKSKNLQKVALIISEAADKGIRPIGKDVAFKAGIDLKAAYSYMSFLNKHSRPSSVPTWQAENLQKVALVVAETAENGIWPSCSYVGDKVGISHSVAQNMINFLNKYSRPSSFVGRIPTHVATKGEKLQKIALVISEAADKGVRLMGKDVAFKAGICADTAYRYISFLNQHSRPESRPMSQSEILQKIALIIAQAADKGIRPTGQYVAEKAGISLKIAYSNMSFLDKHSRPSVIPTKQAKTLQKVALAVAQATDKGIRPTGQYVVEKADISLTTAYSYMSFLEKHSRPSSRPARGSKTENLQKVALIVAQAADNGIRPTVVYVADKAALSPATAHNLITFLNKHSRPSSIPNRQAETLQKVALVVAQAVDNSIRPTIAYVANKAGIGTVTAHNLITFLNKHSRPSSIPSWQAKTLQKVALVISEAADQGISLTGKRVADEADISLGTAYSYMSFLNKHSRPSSIHQ